MKENSKRRLRADRQQNSATRQRLSSQRRAEKDFGAAIALEKVQDRK
jgi:hypothetical protein